MHHTTKMRHLVEPSSRRSPPSTHGELHWAHPLLFRPFVRQCLIYSLITFWCIFSRLLPLIMLTLSLKKYQTFICQLFLVLHFCFSLHFLSTLAPRCPWPVAFSQKASQNRFCHLIAMSLMFWVLWDVREARKQRASSSFLANLSTKSTPCIINHL